MKYIFNSGDKYLIRLSSSDPILGKLITYIGEYELELNQNYYLKLIRSIIGQQLSVKAADTIFSRVEGLCGKITPRNVLIICDEEFKGAGVSKYKINYIKHLTEEVISN